MIIKSDIYIFHRIGLACVFPSSHTLTDLSKCVVLNLLMCMSFFNTPSMIMIEFKVSQDLCDFLCVVYRHLSS